ncbi:hypothetical protein KC19_VG011400 [Ceratodon purpureus]|uniref:Uncharacterized protein n=1 Tax=Ceratodon purpureus TaxID=3225 RepID=A0A8T0HKU8_CERPU|nr:hypothetical protein KC19_VG011400 [Ceratodon purpureus]
MLLLAVKDLLKKLNLRPKIMRWQKHLLLRNEIWKMRVQEWVWHVARWKVGRLFNQVFEYLESLDVEDFKDAKSGYSIRFNFRAYPYSEDTKLTKIFKFSDEGTTSVSGTQPKWKDGMTNGVLPEKEGLKSPLVEESFFKWISDNTQKLSVDGIQDEDSVLCMESGCGVHQGRFVVKPS